MPGLEDVVSQQEALLKKGIEGGLQREKQAGINLRDYRDLMIARSVPPDDVYRLTRTLERVVPPAHGLFRRADPPYSRTNMDFSLCRRGWVVSSAAAISDWDSHTVGQFVGEDGKLYGYVAHRIGPNEAQDFRSGNFTGIPRSDLRPSVYFEGKELLVSEGRDPVQIGEKYGQDDGLEVLAMAARRYRM